MAGFCGKLTGMRLVFALSLLILRTSVVSAQESARVEGAVLDKIAGSGIAGATVRLWNSKNQYEIQTGVDGTFRLTGVAPGTYSSSAEKRDYFVPAMASGVVEQRRAIANGDSVRLKFELNPPAVLRGRVVDEEGNPARATVELGYGLVAETGDDGSFIFENLPPRPYTLSARPKVRQTVSAADGRRSELVRTYYPSATESGEAGIIALASGEKLDGFEIKLRSTYVYRLRGRVVDGTGKPVEKAPVELHARTPGGGMGGVFGRAGRQTFSIRNGPPAAASAPEARVESGEDGTFEFPSVRAGDWILRSQYVTGRDEVRHRDIISTGMEGVNVSQRDVDDVRLEVTTPFALSGTVELSDGSQLPSGAEVVVMLWSDGGLFGDLAHVGSDGKIRLETVAQGRYEIRAQVLGGNYYVSSVTLGAHDITGQVVGLTAVSLPIRILLKPAGTISGSVEEADNATVVVLPSDLTGAGYSTVSGRTFELAGLPPGEYYAIALQQFDSETMADAARLRMLVARATSVRVESGSLASVQLKANLAP
jgi:hypothetical protein